MRVVAGVLDGETITLDDGLEVRLVGAMAPRAPFSGAEAAKRALEELVGGHAVELRFSRQRRDRYGRLLAQIVVQGTAGPQWVQRTLIRSGHSRAYALPGHADCVRDLIAAESAARREKLGLWNEAALSVQRADRTQALLRRAGEFTIVEGTVTEVAHRQRETFINFGDDWRRDFTAGLLRTVLDGAPDGRAWLDSLRGRHVRVRGWIERRNGPFIALVSLEEVEVLDERAGAAE